MKQALKRFNDAKILYKTYFTILEIMGLVMTIVGWAWFVIRKNPIHMRNSTSSGNGKSKDVPKKASELVAKAGWAGVVVLAIGAFTVIGTIWGILKRVQANRIAQS
jgi:hypothetical protein